MVKLVVFKFGDGSFEQGFPITIQVGEDGQRPSTEVMGRLPADPDILRSYSTWHSTYLQVDCIRRLSRIENQISHVSVDDVILAERDLRAKLNDWMRSISFLPVRENLIDQVRRDEEIRVLIQTQDIQLQKLPWHLCDLFESRYPKSEIAISAPCYREPFQYIPRPKIKILAILGDSNGININSDRQILQQLQDAEVKFLVEPPRQEISEQLWKEQWDIIFFAGHSSSQENIGRFYINATESITIEQLRYGLRTAVENGLKLAIFNSCDGLGLARSLFDINIPQIIVMREPVPDMVAQEFLKHFLSSFSSGNSLYQSMRAAREKLQGIEDRFPCATWLPMICQNPIVTPPTWLSIKKGTTKMSKKSLPPIVYIVFALLIAGGAYFFFRKQLESLNTASQTSLLDNTVRGDSSSPSQGLDSRISRGDKILITSNKVSDKQAGVDAYTRKDFATATSKFEAALVSDRNDPETFIYLNNSKIGTSKAIAIGVSVPIGGDLNVAQEILRGVAQAQQEYNNQNQVLPIRIAIANDDNKPEVVTTIAAAFVADPEIIAVVGHNTSDASLAGAPIYQAAGLVMITPTATSKELSNYGSFIFRTAPTARSLAESLASYGIKIGRRANFGICASSRSKSTISLKQEFITAIQTEGGKVSGIECDLTASSFVAANTVSAMVSDGVDALLLAPGIETIEKSMEVAKEAQGKFLLLSESTLYTFKTLKLGQADVNGMILSVPWHPQAIKGSKFTIAAKKLWGGDVNWRSATAYDAMKAISVAASQTKNPSLQPTRVEMQKAIANPNFSLEGATGKIQFQPSGDRTAAVILVKVQAGNSSSTGFDFVPIP